MYSKNVITETVKHLNISLIMAAIRVNITQLTELVVYFLYLLVVYWTQFGFFESFYTCGEREINYEGLGLADMAKKIFHFISR